MADKEDPGSSKPKKREITFKCAVLLIGINSVKPWIKPYNKNSKYSKNFSLKLFHILIAFIKITIYISKVKGKMRIWEKNFW